jgi:hypothetical protein
MVSEMSVHYGREGLAKQAVHSMVPRKQRKGIKEGARGYIGHALSDLIPPVRPPFLPFTTS